MNSTMLRSIMPPDRSTISRMRPGSFPHQTPLGRTAQRLSTKGAQPKYATKEGALGVGEAMIGSAVLGPLVNHLMAPDPPPPAEIPPPDLVSHALQARQARMAQAMMPVELPPFYQPHLQQAMPPGMLAQLAMQQSAVPRRVNLGQFIG